MNNELKEELVIAIETAACMLRGMLFDPAIPSHAKDAMRDKITELESLAERALED